MQNDSTILEIRRFNRFYTNILGLIDQHILSSPFSLTEARILFEIGTIKNCTASKLMDSLEIDRGYMSRILKKFAKEGLTGKEKDAKDSRISLLSLTRKGKAELTKLAAESSKQILRLISHLQENEVRHLLNAMSTIESTLNSFKINSFKKRDIDRIIKKHEDLYSEEYGFDRTFADYVTATLHKFCQTYDQNKENIWIAESGDDLAGSIGIVKADEKTAQLRWFLVDSRFRGRGLGRKLMEEALAFCREKKYENVFLQTVDKLKTARLLYQKFGFKLTRTIEQDIWSQHLVEEYWELDLGLPV